MLVVVGVVLLLGLLAVQTLGQGSSDQAAKEAAATAASNRLADAEDRVNALDRQIAERPHHRRPQPDRSMT